MHENKYDDSAFFEQYRKMPRSVDGLRAAGEWHVLQTMLPGLAGKAVLDLGCGFGWHCRYASEQGAGRVVGVDISEKMLAEAERRNKHPNIEYRRSAIEDVGFPDATFDVVLSSLALHYVDRFDALCVRVARLLRPGGHFVFSVEHPVFTAYGNQDWWYGPNGERLHWPVDRYFSEGWREAVFLGEKVAKRHRTLAAYFHGLLAAGFAIGRVEEPRPAPELMEAPGMAEELRRPMMLLLAAQKS